jgi:hypothetical protein
MAPPVWVQVTGPGAWGQQQRQGCHSQQQGGKAPHLLVVPRPLAVELLNGCSCRGRHTCSQGCRAWLGIGSQQGQAVCGLGTPSAAISCCTPFFKVLSFMQASAFDRPC